jgi:hypothetical protein
VLAADLAADWHAMTTVVEAARVGAAGGRHSGGVDLESLAARSHVVDQILRVTRELLRE